MKRIAALLISILLICSTSFAENIDLSTLSIEELHTLQTRIDQELLNRGELRMWFDYGIGAHIPMIQLESGEEPKLDEFQINSDTNMYVRIMNVQDGDFDKYVADLILLGFTEVIEQSRLQYSARNADGYKVEVTNWSSSGISVKGEPPLKK